MADFSPDDPMAMRGRNDAGVLWHDGLSDDDIVAFLHRQSSVIADDCDRRVYLHAARNELQVLLAKREGGVR